MTVDQSVINYAVYEDANEYLGIAEITLPDISFLSQTISGSGIAGNVEAVLVGMTEAMTMTASFRNLTSDTVRLAEPRRHNLTLRVATQADDTVAAKVGIIATKHVMVATPKSLKGGTLKVATPNDASTDYAVSYWAAWQDGKKVLEIDPLNFICIINGVDYLASVKKALGK